MVRQPNWVLFVALALASASFGATVTRVSRGVGGERPNGGSYVSDVSADGRYVVFSSSATNIVAENLEGYGDVFVWDRATRRAALVSLGADGHQGAGESDGGRLSGNGRYVVFNSMAALVPDDTNGKCDVYVRDLVTRQTKRASLATSGDQPDGASSDGRISDDGRYVAFVSYASNLGYARDGCTNIFVRDVTAGSTTCASTAVGGDPQDLGSSWMCEISGDGRYVAFESSAADLVVGDTNHSMDVFVRDMRAGQTARVSVATTGEQGNNLSAAPGMSDDGRYVAFCSAATNLVPDDTNGFSDVFLRDRATGRTTRVTLTDSGLQADGNSGGTDVSGDGRYVAFESSASNLVGRDTNGLPDVFIRDLVTGRTTRISRWNAGHGQNDLGAVDADGRYVAFGSVTADAQSGVIQDEVFLWDRGSTPPPAPSDPEDPPAPPADYSPGTLLRANFHTHTSASTNWNDHLGAPTVRALIQRACDLGLTVLGVSDHAEAVDAGEWCCTLLNGTTPPTRVRAALRGFEWTQATDGNPLHGGNHINTFGTQDTAIANSDGEGAGFGDLRSDVPSFYNWLADAPGIYGTAPVGQFNHVSIDGSHFGSWALPTNSRVRRLVLSRMALAELAIGSHVGASGVQPQETYPYNPREGEVQWRAALAKGWRLAPSFGADNYAGLSDDARRFHTGVYLYATDTPGQWSVMRALAGRRTFASQDARAEAQLLVKGYFMGCQGVTTTSPVPLLVKYRPRSAGGALDVTSSNVTLVWDGLEKPVPTTPGKWDGQYYTWSRSPNFLRGNHWVYARIRQNDGDLLYTAPVWFTVTGTAAVAAPLVVSATSALPTRQGGVQVGFTLSAAATVEITITNLAGRPVRCVGSGLARAAGTHTLLWDGRSATGLSVPAGRYLVKVAACSTDGQQASGLTAVNLSR